MTEHAAGPPSDEALARRLARLQTRPNAARPTTTVAAASSPASGPVNAPAGRRRSPFRRRRHVAVGARRLAAGAGAAGTLGLVATMALTHASATVTSTVTTVTTTVGADGGAALTSTDPSTLLPGGQGRPTTTATAAPAPAEGSTHGSG